MRKSKAIAGSRRRMITKGATIRGELREWIEVGMNESRYFRGRLYGDKERIIKDGSNFITGYVLVLIDRGDYFLVRTLGKMVYILYKDEQLR